MSDDLPNRVTKVEMEISNLKERHYELSSEVESLRDMLEDTRTEMMKGLADIREKLSDVVTKAINSMPEWAARQLANNHRMNGVLGALLGVAVSAALALWLGRVSP